jgi:chromosome segregation ATPase
MANDKNNTNELVAEDDDPTVELEMLADTYDFIGQKREEVDPSITELESNLQNRSETGNQRQSGELVSAKAEVRELRTQLDRMESYADDIRQKLQERTSLTDRAENTQGTLRNSLDRVTQQVEQLESELEEARASSKVLANLLDRTRESHAEEIRMIRFELGEAQGTVTEHELLTEQLASDLVNTREFRDELERVLNETEEQTQSRIEELERENRKLKDDLAHNEEQLESKSEALNSLLAELAKKSQQIESIGEIEDVIHEIDDRVSERFDDRTHKDRDRVTRVLIGSVDGQELRFPLFKDRLTIGRTDQNDIQLQASYVSRRHAVIVSDRNATRIVDWGSKNGVFVNSERITEHFLRNGDNLAIGTAEFRYEERPKRDN